MLVIASTELNTASNQAHPLVDTLYYGYCEDILPYFAPESIDLIITSPPYADRRNSTYGDIHPDKYVEWFLPISAELKRVLKSNGSFVLNIKERVVNGERHTYVIELILEMRKQGWLWTEEYCWHKKTPTLVNGQIAFAIRGSAVCISPNSANLRCIKKLSWCQ